MIVGSAIIVFGSTSAIVYFGIRALYVMLYNIYLIIGLFVGLAKRIFNVVAGRYQVGIQVFSNPSQIIDTSFIDFNTSTRRMMSWNK